MEGSKVRKVNGVKPPGSLNGKINCFSPVLLKVFHITRDVENDNTSMVYWDKQKLCTDRGDDKKWGIMPQASLDTPMAIMFQHVCRPSEGHPC